MTVGLVIPKSRANCGVAGAIIEEETGEMNVNAETMAVAAHFFLKDQLKVKIYQYEVVFDDQTRHTYFFGF